MSEKKYVFADSEKLYRLNSIIFQYLVRNSYLNQISKNENNPPRRFQDIFENHVCFSFAFPVYSPHNKGSSEILNNDTSTKYLYTFWKSFYNTQTAFLIGNVQFNL